MQPAFISVEEASVYLGVPSAQVYALVKSKGFPVRRIGRHYRIHVESLIQWSTDFSA